MTDTRTQTHSAPSTAATGNKRLVSLDVLRGITVAFMILVNTAGDGSASYSQLRHSVWNGCTLTDLVFPLFLFIMGLSMTLSIEGRLLKGTAKRHIALQAVKRAAIIVLLGLTLNALPYFQFATLRYCGVMQRIGVCYLLAAFLLLFTRMRGVALAAASALLLYWALMTFVPVPGFGLSGAELGMLNPTGNLVSAIDRAVIPKQHLYHQSFYDPEGLLSTVPALATVLLGVLTAAWFRAEWASRNRRLTMLAAFGGSLVLLALAWSPYFPINKRLWTSPYVLFTAGVSMILLAGFAWIIDESGWFSAPTLRRILTPWLAFGSNALTAYLLSEVLAIALGSLPMAGSGNLQRFTFTLIPVWLGSAAMRSLLWSLLFTGLCFLPILWLYRKRILIKL